MQNQIFLDIIADKLIEKYQYNFSNVIVVLPNKRAIVFLLEALKNKSNQPFFAPKILSIQTFFQEVSQLETIDNINLLFELYNTYCEIQDSKTNQTFIEFANWGKTALSDFNEIDNYLIDANSILSYLKDVERLKKWELDSEKSNKPLEFLKFWELLPLYYQKLKSNLLEKKLGYNGLINRIASEKIISYVKENNNLEFIFAGFNALNKCEESILKYLLKENKAQVYWDSDDTILNDPYHHAGLHLRKVKSNWSYFNSHPFEFIFDNYKQEKNIQIISTSQNIGQAKIAGQILDNLSKSEIDLSKTALILGNEELLLPILNELPSSLNSLNITMGYPVILTTFHHLILNIFKLHINSLKRNEKKPVFYYKEVLTILSDPNVFTLVNDHNFERQINQNNYTFFSYKTLESLSNKNEIINLIFNQNINSTTFLSMLVQLIEKIKKSIESNVEQKDVIKLSFLYEIYQSLLKLKNYIIQNNSIESIEELFMFYKEIISFSEVSFEGKPLSGLQIIGMLESRLLDFENLIVTNVNEGFIPAGKTNNSFIPLDIKREFDLPTNKDKDALISYHFYRLISRAKNIYFIYNDDATGMNSGEKSRFLSQIEINPQKNHHISKLQYYAQIPLEQKKPFIVTKDDLILEALKNLATSGFSPSSLNTYVRDKEQFYTQYVLQIKQFDEVEENIAANTFGTIVHNILENLYIPLVGKNINIDNIEDLFLKIDSETHKVFTEVYKKGEISKGKNMISLEVAKQYVRKYLEIEKKSLATDSLIILALEKKYECIITDEKLPFPIKLKGKIDRIELRNSKIRIIDFKAGKVESKSLNINSWEYLTTKITNDKKIQLMCYLLMTQNEDEFKNYEVETGIISFKKLNNGFLPLINGIDKNNSPFFTQEDKENFKQELITLILEILNKDIAFEGE
jgi:rRNA-processing protein FCF1